VRPVSRIGVSVVLLFAAFGLAGCKIAGDLEMPVAFSSTASVIGESPAQVYARIARRARACWFEPGNPVLTKHEFRAEARGDGSRADINIYEVKPKGKLDKVFVVKFRSREDGTVIGTDNISLPYALGQKLTSDVGRWAQGNQACEGKPNAGSAGRGSHGQPQSASAPPGGASGR